MREGKMPVHALECGSILYLILLEPEHLPPDRQANRHGIGSAAPSASDEERSLAKSA
jgi:hypothetical protein